MIIDIDPRKISQRSFGGPYFATFDRVGKHYIKCTKTGDVFYTREINAAWMESRDLAPIVKE